MKSNHPEVVALLADQTLDRFRSPERAGEIMALSLTTPGTLEQIEAAEKELLHLPQIDVPITHLTGRGGVYLRLAEVVQAGMFAIGHKHLRDHYSILLSGRVRCVCDGEVQELTAPAILFARAGTRKVVMFLEDSQWLNIHPSNETDVAKLEAEMFEPSPTWTLHHAELKLLETAVSP